ncbi:cytosolic phospholipase A2 gamma-like [Sceloporus undulatus]|uniref:cytosolic phospholipase A2 gamma-like n=1 Tax=Sceloporus undulatus TaxID=8520 RepID=UPI001C4C3AC5|nr:cytosolic phospholipase A2 gamma-like [Sceloporus undulatus]
MENGTLNEDMLAFKKSDTIRISRDISDKEKATIGRRKANVQDCLQKLGVNCTMSSVPNIAILGSGGGLRAMIALQGVLVELQKQGLLDAVMYLCGVSGSTWCMSYIYKHELWVTQLPTLEKKLCDKLTNTAWDPKKALDALVEQCKDDTYSLTDLWGNVIVYGMVHELDDHKLSEERRVSSHGKVPYPIYAAVDSSKLADNSKIHPEIWFEFTPDEAGFIHSGAFVDMRLFGSVFENGKLRKIKEEKSLSYLRGLWGSAIASPTAIEDFIKQLISGTENLVSGCHCLHCRSASCVIKLLVHAIENKTHEYYNEHIRNLMELLKARTSPHIIHEETKRSTWDVLRILRKTITCISEWKWGTISSYLYKFSGLNDKDLIVQKDIQLVDAGLAINSAYPLVLRPEREVKLILSFDFSEGDPFETVKQAALYCKESQIPFPDIDASELDKSQDNPSDCYIFQSNNAPVVMHFPLFNKVNCKDKVDEWREKYSTLNLSYTEEEIKDLLEAAKTNVRNNAGTILQAIKNVSIL